MPGFDAATGRLVDPWTHTMAAIAMLLTTQLGERQMRGWVGSACPKLLGENLSPDTIEEFIYFATLAIALHEPRFAIVDADIAGIEGAPSGEIGLIFVGEFRPGALRGDLSRAEPREVAFAYDSGLWRAAVRASA